MVSFFKLMMGLEFWTMEQICGVGYSYKWEIIIHSQQKRGKRKGERPDDF